MKLGLAQMARIEWSILKAVHAHPGISRVELARELRIAPSTAGSYVSRLIDARLLVEAQ
jgi:DNA-binding MarR family transcriptional regulator